MKSTLMDSLDADRRRALENVRAAAVRIWSRPLHRYYTDHTVTHSERVIGLLDGLTGGVMATGKRLSPTEVFVLLAAAYLHDIGMQDERFAGGNLEEIRAHHHEQTAEMIYAVFEDPANALAIPLAREPGIVEAVALVARGHRRVDLSGAEYAPFVHGGETVRLRLLAALLRFGDELDIDHRRVDVEQMKLLALPVESQLHWWKCHYVSGVSIVDEYIRVAYRFPQARPDYEGLIVPLVEGEIRTRHAALEEIFRADAVKVALGQPQVRLMRLVQPLPPEVEVLARQRLKASEITTLPRAEDAPAGVHQDKAEAVAPPASPAPVTLFDQRGQTFSTQINVAGDYVDRRKIDLAQKREEVAGLEARLRERGAEQPSEPGTEPQPGPTPTRPAVPLYRDFEILIGDRRGRSYPVQVIASPAGEGESAFKPPFAEDELQAALDRLERYDTDEPFLADFGARLFAALFAGDVRARYAESVGLTGQDAGLRIRLRLDPPDLQELPWELLRDPEKREFLVLSKRALVTRYLHVPRPTPPLEIEPPLRVLVVVAAPQGQVPLDTDDEVARIRQALRPLLDGGTVEIAVEPHVTKRGLRGCLLDDGPHVLHYVGHGDLDLDNDRGVLLLEDEGGGVDPLDGPTLGTLLKGSSVRLAVLNACLSARDSSPPVLGGAGAPGFRGRRAALLGVGPALVDAGLGAVVAMQFSVADESARVFAGDFYTRLARFEPVDVCVSRAREALLLEVGLDQRDWATPVLFMRAPDGVLFRGEGRHREE
jgi:hypothetical protein